MLSNLTSQYDSANDTLTNPDDVLLKTLMIYYLEFMAFFMLGYFGGKKNIPTAAASTYQQSYFKSLCQGAAFGMLNAGVWAKPDAGAMSTGLFFGYRTAVVHKLGDYKRALRE